MGPGVTAPLSFGQLNALCMQSGGRSEQAHESRGQVQGVPLYCMSRHSCAQIWDLAAFLHGFNAYQLKMPAS